MHNKSKTSRVAAMAAVIRCLGLSAVILVIAGPDALAAPCGQAPDEIVVRISNLRNSQGNVVAELYPNDPANFLKGRARIERAFLPLEGVGTIDVCLIAPAPGTYAVAVYHDENANIKFDKNWIGLPTEGYGISNNPTTFLGPPAFDDAKFETLTGSTTVVPIELKY